MAEPNGFPPYGPGPCTDSLGNQPSGSRIVVAMARNNTSDAHEIGELINFGQTADGRAT